MLVYKLPSEPSRYRAAVWRKLKAARAIYLQNGVAALPLSAASERLMRGVVQEIRQIAGTAYLVRGEMVGDEAGIVAAFNAARDEEYTEVIRRCQDFHAELERERAARNFTFAELEENDEDLSKLERWLAKVQARDHFGATLGTEAQQAVRECRQDLDAFADLVYQATDHGSADQSDTHEDAQQFFEGKAR